MTPTPHSHSYHDSAAVTARRVLGRASAFGKLLHTKAARTRDADALRKHLTHNILQFVLFTGNIERSRKERHRARVARGFQAQENARECR